MKTDQFIDALVADRRRDATPAASLAKLMSAACLLSIVALLVTAGLRPDLGMAASTPRVIFKWLLVVALVVASTGALLRVARPEAHLGMWSVGLIGVFVALIAGVAVELLVVPGDQWASQARGVNATWCLRMTPLLAATPLFAAFAVLRRAAPTRPTLAGAMAGLTAGAAGAALYALHCTDDSPLFVATWYTAAILGVTALGALLGRRLLRW